VSGDLANRYAALHLILGDLAFSSDCLKEAAKLGVPDDQSVHSKALIFAGVVAYGRCFTSGVRDLKLDPDDLTARAKSFDEEIHAYLYDLRNKHIAHSVNDFEGCEPAGIIVGRSESGWRAGGVGVVLMQGVGLSLKLLNRAVAHIDAMRAFLKNEVVQLRPKVYEVFRAEFEATGKWEMVPALRMPSREKIGERR
jgi:hypothetical protein